MEEKIEFDFDEILEKFRNKLDENRVKSIHLS